MSAPLRFTVAAAEAGERLDVYLARRLDGGRAAAQRRIADGDVRIDGRPAKAAARLAAGAVVAVAAAADAPPAPLEAAPEIALDVRWVDDAIVVVAKPAGLVVHPGLGHAGGTLVNALVARFPDLAAAFGPDDPRPGLVHRLDADTSGLLVVARTPAVRAALQAQFKARTVDKTYLAIVRGVPNTPYGLIDAPLGRDAVHRQRMAVVPGGRLAVTGYHVAASRPTDSLVVVRLFTGRTHQIRVHLAAIGHPVAGDRLYGRPDRDLGRMALHAWRLALDHPTTGARLALNAPPPDDLAGELARRYGDGWPALADASAAVLADWPTPDAVAADAGGDDDGAWSAAADGDGGGDLGASVVGPAVPAGPTDPVGEPS